MYKRQRINNATDGYSGIGDSFKFKVTNETEFEWVSQFGSTTGSMSGTGINQRYNSIWHAGGASGSQQSTFSDNHSIHGNGTSRLFTWYWSGHGNYHGWSSGQSETERISKWLGRTRITICSIMGSLKFF
mgnify:CR=1 FL=1